MSLDRLKHAQPAEIQMITRIASGGTSEVWLATHPKTSTPFVLKYASSPANHNPYLAGMFEREFEVSRLLKTHHIDDISPAIAHFDFDEDNHPYLLMEYFPSQSLASLFSELTSWNPMRPILRHLLKTCARIHAAGIVHGDLKPTNILIDNAGNLRLIDFSLSTIHGALHPNHDGPFALGTPWYMSPEQAMHTRMSCATDAYALGIILFEWITGHVPYQGKTIEETLNMHCQAPIPPLVRTSISDLPQDLYTIVPKLMDRNTDTRNDAFRALYALVTQTS